jgi:hypothetical protein
MIMGDDEMNELKERSQKFLKTKRVKKSAQNPFQSSH